MKLWAQNDTTTASDSNYRAEECNLPMEFHASLQHLALSILVAAICERFSNWILWALRWMLQDRGAATISTSLSPKRGSWLRICIFSTERKWDRKCFNFRFVNYKTFKVSSFATRHSSKDLRATSDPVSLDLDFWNSRSMSRKLWTPRFLQVGGAVL